MNTLSKRAARKLLIALTLSFAAGYAQAGTDVPIVKQEIPMGGSETKIAYGIFVKVGNGGSPRLFQLDTGNGSFLAGYASSPSPGNQFWGSYTSEGSTTYQADFGSSVEMFYQKVTAQVTLSNSTGTNLVTIPSMALGQVYNATGPSTNNWQQQLENGEAPLHQTYYGNFGAGIYSPSDAPSLFSALGQISGATGFVLSLHGASPKLTVMFDTPEDRAHVNSFPYATSTMAGDGTVYPVTGWNTSVEQPMLATSFNANGLTSDGTTGLFDSGGTTFDLADSAASAFSSLSNGDGLVSGVNFTTGFAGAGMIDGVDYSSDFEVGFSTGDEEGVNEVSFTDETDKLNFGPSIYNYYDVYFDLKNEAVRFKPVPEPGTGLLVAVGSLVVGLRRARRNAGVK